MQQPLKLINAGQYRATLPIYNARGKKKMTWEIFVGITVVISFAITVATYASKQAGVLSELRATLEALNATLKQLKEDNKQSHKEIYERLDKCETEIARLKVFHEK